MNFVRYDNQTGLITAIGYMDPRYIQKEIEQGLPTLFITYEFDRLKFRVNLKTKTIEPLE
jgi:hypothetical protein